MADVRVFVDGQLRFNRAKLRCADGPVEVDVPWGPTDRFLTLVSTDGGDGMEADVVFYHHPPILLLLLQG